VKLEHKNALNLAANHFSVSFALGIVWLGCVWGQGLSDSYQDDPLWLKILIGVLWILQTPAAVLETIFRRSSPFGASFFLLIIVSILWSVLLGYAFCWIKKRSRSR